MNPVTSVLSATRQAGRVVVGSTTQVRVALRLGGLSIQANRTSAPAAFCSATPLPSVYFSLGATRRRVVSPRPAATRRPTGESHMRGFALAALGAASIAFASAPAAAKQYVDYTPQKG